MPAKSRKSTATTGSAYSTALERAALLGREFPLALLRGTGVGDDAITALFDAGTLANAASAGHARFTSAALVGRVKRSIPWSRARDHHMAIGEAARQLRLSPEMVASHFEAAHRFDLARAQWLRAAETACASGKYRQAMDTLDRALAIWPWTDGPEDRARVLRAVARCASNARMPDCARRAWEELLDHARETSQHSVQLACLHELAGLSHDVARTGALLTEAARLAAASMPAPDAVRHALALVDHLANRLRITKAQRAFDEAEPIAEASGDPALISEMRGWKGLLAAMAGDAKSAALHVEESLRIAVTHELPEQTATAYKRRANIADYEGNYALEKSAHEEAIRFCRDHNAGDAAVCMSCMSYACFRTGDWKEAVETAAQVLHEPDQHIGLRAIASGVKGLVATFRGVGAPARQTLEEALALQRGQGCVGMEFLTLWALAFWHSFHGDPMAATAHYDEIRSLWRGTDDAHDAIPGLLFAGAHYADRGCRERLADCVDILHQIRQRNDLLECRAAVLALGAEQARLDGEADAASAMWKEAAELESRSGLPLERLWIECRRAAPEHQRDAITLGTRLGARPLLALLTSGTDSEDATALTPRQRVVLAYIASGLTSKEIGDRMALSTRTVEMHVGRLLRRLHCRTRPEAVALAQSRGLLK